MGLLLIPAGLLLGPVLHHLAVRSAAHAPFLRGIPTCEACCRTRPAFGFTETPCEACGTKPRLRRWALGLFAGVGMWMGYLAVGWSAVLPGFLVFAGTTAILTATDLDEMIIPNRIIYPAGLAATALLGVGAAIEENLREFGWALVIGVGYFLLFFLVFMVARGGFGFGDVRLAALLGVFTGYLGWTTFAIALFITGMAGGLVAVAALAAGKGRKFALPYGPLMVVGAWGALVFTDAIVRSV